MGIVCIVAAASLALDPDYPVPRSVLRTLAGSHVTSRGLDAVMPRGEIGEVPASFRWLWEGEPSPFTVVLLDSEHREVCRLVAEGRELPVEGALDRALEPGETFHWYVETAQREGVVRSVPSAFVISR